MNQAAQEQDFEFEDETVAESLQSAKVQSNQSDDDDGFEIEVVDDTQSRIAVSRDGQMILKLKSQMTMRFSPTAKVCRSASSS
jgi:transcription antitermination factor NusA-like protein